jgi:hypothetical protein
MLWTAALKQAGVKLKRIALNFEQYPAVIGVRWVDQQIHL